MKCEKVGPMKSPMQRSCAAAVRSKGKIGSMSQSCRLVVKESFDSTRCKLGKIIHDGGYEANRLWDLYNDVELVKK